MWRGPYARGEQLKHEKGVRFTMYVEVILHYRYIIMPNGESHPRKVVPESFLVGKNKLVYDITTETIMLIQHETIHIHLQLNA